VTVLSQTLFEDLCAGRRRALSRAISWVESDAPQASALLEKVYAHAPQPWVIGITGVGGAGKSSLVPHLARRLAAAGESVAVLAVDPTSPISGGALLGDRLRDSSGQQDPNVFFRSVATRGGQGGLATCVADLVRVAAAAGCKTVIVETVGAGQSELGILQVAHSIVLVAAPGLGDDVQAQKAGVMEVANVMVVNKADREGADRAERDLLQMLDLRADGERKEVEILRTIASRGLAAGSGLADLAAPEGMVRFLGAGTDRSRNVLRMRSTFHRVLEGLAGRYVVLINGPSVPGPVPTSQLLSLADATLMVVAEGQTSLTDARSAGDTLRSFSSGPAGVVVLRS
jgi:LAO/AO transport system kinase